MGNLQGSHEISVEEQEEFEMQVEEDYNPNSTQTVKEARLEYLQRLRKREAEDFRLKYLRGDKGMPAQADSSVNRNYNINEIRSTVVVHEESKNFHAKQQVTYVFQELGHPQNPAPPDENNLDSLSKILNQKEKIRSLITPDPDCREQEMLNIV